jgi:4-oxalocrotonate tautomerase
MIVTPIIGEGQLLAQSGRLSLRLFAPLHRSASLCVLGKASGTTPAANRRSLEPSASKKEKHMPLVRINLSRTASPKLRQTVSDVVYDAMIAVAKVPADDKFQIFTGHAADELVFPKQGYLGIDYTDGIIFIQVTWNAGRSTEVKKAFYRKIADDLHTKADVRKQDVFISLVDVLPENWSFGNGEMQYAPKQ